MTYMDTLRAAGPYDVPEPGTWTDDWRRMAYMGRGAVVIRHSDDAPSSGRDLRAGDVGLAFRCWYPGGGSELARVAILTGPMAGEAIDTLADDWVDAPAEVVEALAELGR